jgi:3-deoxy-D-manno-octulosonic-acid transferase
MFIRLPSATHPSNPNQALERTWINHLYDLGIFVYWNLAKLWALKNSKAQKWVEGRKNWYKTLFTATENWTDSKTIWFQCASLGEFEQARPVIEGIRKQFPESKILLTFYSPSGYEVRKNYAEVDFVCYLPFDFRFDMELFLDLVKPRVVVFTKYDFWLNAFEAIRSKRIPLVCLSVHLNSQKINRWPLRAYYRQIFDCVHVVLAQNQDSAAAVKLIKPSLSTRVTGDTRIDRVLDLASNHATDANLAAWKGSNSLFIIGSAWPEDIAALADWINQANLPQRILIAPHEIKEKAISVLMKPVNKEWQLVSAGQWSSNIQVLDSMGQLANLYGHADFVWVGGAFKQGLHNILEPAVFGVPVFFGPQFQKFQEAVDLESKQLAFSCSTSQEFDLRLVSAFERKNEIRQKLQKYFDSQKGASQKAINLLSDLLNKKHGQ